MDSTAVVLLGDCLEQMKTLPDNSVDSIVTDPPYGLSFMGKKWDYQVPSVDIWKEALRVLKPGGHVLSFCGTRTYHRMVVNMEDAGFEIRDQVQWLYGSGFPKSLDVSKAIDKAAGAEREVIGTVKKTHVSTSATNDGWTRPSHYNEDGTHKTEMNITAPATDAAKQWQGWGTALKPANEPICLARKPLEKKLTVAENVMKFGTGGLNIDASRVASSSTDQGKMRVPIGKIDSGNVNMHRSGVRTEVFEPNTQGRFPANLILDEVAAEILDQQSRVSTRGVLDECDHNECDTVCTLPTKTTVPGPSRFFYVAKASKAERNRGCEDLGVKQKQGARPKSADASGKFPDHDHRESGGNNHPTVKPIKLMEYLIKLITPPGGIVLDPFTGSGSTGVAAVKNGFNFIGCEMDPAYLAIAEKRIDAAASAHIETVEDEVDEEQESA